MTERLAVDGGAMAVQRFDDSFTWPIVTEEDERAVLDVLRRGAMSESDVTERFESEYADWQDRTYALGCNSGTAALWGAMYGVGVGVGDEVITPSVAYWAAVTPCMGLGATPVFADIDPETLCLDPQQFADRITDHTKAVVVVHNYGHPAAMDEIVAIARDHGVAVIEDASHAQGGQYRGRTVGTFGDVTATSFMSWKPLVAGEAGMLATDDRDVYERAIEFGHYRRREEIPKRPELAGAPRLPLGGRKHEMHQLSAAVGRVQLRRYDDRIREIQRAMNYFWDLLEDVPGLRAHRPDDPETTMGGWYLPKGHYEVDELGGCSVETFAKAVSAEGSICRVDSIIPLHTHPLFCDLDVYGHGAPTRLANARRDVLEPPERLPVSETIQARCLTVPWFRRYRPAVIEQHADAYRKVATHYASA